MTLENTFHDAMLDVYAQAGKEVGYWANYFLRSVKQYGGLECARRMLSVRKDDTMQKGFQALIDAGRIDISMESLILKPEFISLFTDSEIQEARRRLEEVPDYALRKQVPTESIFPEAVPPDLPYTEGATQKIIVNFYERNPRARAACLAKHGYSCAVCSINFREMYGTIGEGFIHVHHKKPLATIRAEYVLDPIKDLIPVCPNCHAMLHTCEPPLSITELKSQITSLIR